MQLDAVTIKIGLRDYADSLNRVSVFLDHDRGDIFTTHHRKPNSPLWVSSGYEASGKLRQTIERLSAAVTRAWNSVVLLDLEP